MTIITIPFPFHYAAKAVFSDVNCPYWLEMRRRLSAYADTILHCPGRIKLAPLGTKRVD